MENTEESYLVEGRNAVIELLKSSREINKMLVQKGEKNGSINEIIQLARQKKVVIQEVEKRKLDEISQTGHHQGVIVYTSPQKYYEVDDILDLAKKRNEEPFIVILDNIEDPHNLGSIIRTCEVLGVHGIIIPKRRTALITAVVEKVSAGATSYLMVSRVNNLNQIIEYLKKQNIWVIGTDMEAPKEIYETDLTGAIALVIGSEGFGMNKLVKENCDILVKIPMQGKVTSLNAGVSAGIGIYEIIRQRNICRK